MRICESCNSKPVNWLVDWTSDDVVTLSYCLCDDCFVNLADDRNVRIVKQRFMLPLTDDDIASIRADKKYHKEKEEK